MTDTQIRDIEPKDYDRIVELNAGEVEWTSVMNRNQLHELVSLASYRNVLVADSLVIGFLLAMPHDSHYENDNFDWFSGLYENFLYVDRIVIDAEQSGSGHGRAFYEHIISHAKEKQIKHLVCEYTFRPSNEASKAFHKTMGFSEVGQRQLADSEKIVSLQCLKLNAH